MNNPERKANLALDALVFLLALALLTFITRLWPILLLVILGIFAASLRLLFLSAKQTPKEPAGTACLGSRTRTGSGEHDLFPGL